MDLWGKGGSTIFGESGERESKRARQEGEGHAIPRMTAVLEVNAGDAALRGSVFRHVQCLKTSSTSASLMFFLQIRLHGCSRYDVGAAVGLGLTQPLVTRVI